MAAYTADTVNNALRSGWGLLRSIAIYRSRPWQIAAFARFYGQFLQSGDLAFDIGAHVGNRTLALRRAGARVVAVEPQRLFHSFLRQTLPADVTLLPCALGAQSGEAELAVSRLHPTVSSLRMDYCKTVGQSAGFTHVDWDAREKVSVSTLDTLIADHGMPRLVKIDVEGFEAEVLAGLSRPVSVVAFEYLPAALDVAAAAVKQLTDLGPYRFNIVQGENRHFALPDWTSGQNVLASLAAIARNGRSGDLYATLPEGAPPL